jgi:5-methylcytosine-specific restriction endonuclease McrA
MDVYLVIGALFFVGWFFNRLGRKPPSPPSPPKTLLQLEQEKLEQARIDEQIRQSSLKRWQEREASRAEWRSKYSKYLNSPKWKRVRKRVLEKANHTCAYCGRPAKHVHHRKYPRGHKGGEFKRENYDYLVAICAKCHMKEHHL